eukprot:TRINITY_DN3511_c0_g7_i1.p1 TRINITY_DN3511_c0_g7~~TRINITY_DN3511_c0_g7_i1.p1  ORF type:complete len:113 (-),score=5.57 TRINITY_DN3511_c0_g7_i1:80-418(-)
MTNEMISFTTSSGNCRIQPVEHNRQHTLAENAIKRSIYDGIDLSNYQYAQRGYKQINTVVNGFANGELSLRTAETMIDHVARARYNGQNLGQYYGSQTDMRTVPKNLRHLFK